MFFHNCPRCKHAYKKRMRHCNQKDCTFCSFENFIGDDRGFSFYVGGYSVYVNPAAPATHIYAGSFDYDAKSFTSLTYLGQFAFAVLPDTTLEDIEKILLLT